MTPPATPERSEHHRFPTEIISHGVWLYYRFCLGYRDVEELLLPPDEITLNKLTTPSAPRAEETLGRTRYPLSLTPVSTRVVWHPPEEPPRDGHSLVTDASRVVDTPYPHEKGAHACLPM